MIKTNIKLVPLDKINSRLAILLIAVLAMQTASPCAGYEFLGNKKWEPGINTVSARANMFVGPMTPGGASWSAVPSMVGVSPDAPTNPFPSGALTTDIEFLITPEVDGLEHQLFSDAMNAWASISGFVNLGKVDDGATLYPGSALIADTDANHGHIGDIRAAAIPFSTVEFARGYAPCINNFDDCDDGGSIGGNIFFNIATTWVDDPNHEMTDTGADFYTVALHEIGHALGLHHSFVDGAVMQGEYRGARRTLTQDDIDGAIALYGLVPEPSSAGLALLGMIGILSGRFRSRQRR